MPHSSLNSNPLPGTANSRVPIVNSTSITGAGAGASPPTPPAQHISGVPWNTNLFDCKSTPNWFLGWSNSPKSSLHVSIFQILLDKPWVMTMGVWVNPFGFVISSIIPFIEGPGVINKQNSEWWSNYTTGRDGRLQHWWLRGAQWLPCSDACNYLLCWRCDGEEAGGGVKGVLNSEAV